MSGQFAQQLDHHPLLFRGKRRERRSGYAGRNLHRRLGCAPPAIGECDRPAAAVFGIAKCGHEAAQMQAINHALDGRRIEIDKSAEIVLRTRANLVELGERGELRLREALDHARGEDRRMALHRNAHEEPDLIIKHIAIFRYVGLGYDFQFFTPQCFHGPLPTERHHPIPSDKSFAPPGWHRARRPTPANGFDPFPERRPYPIQGGQNGCSVPTAGSTNPAFSA